MRNVLSGAAMISGALLFLTIADAISDGFSAVLHSIGLGFIARLLHYPAEPSDPDEILNAAFAPALLVVLAVSLALLWITKPRAKGAESVDELPYTSRGGEGGDQ